jgi:hypothetical protein
MPFPSPRRSRASRTLARTRAVIGALAMGILLAVLTLGLSLDGAIDAFDVRDETR